ncbi:hypothetical protein [Niastella vici]|uniref:hypothetical protein n=1 Tax=Niastella vici TaxID=1703345 RepID=UPI0009C08809|nr:hypothetical protein [Niastella vici]
MRKPLLIIGLLAAIVYACNQGNKIKNPLLSTSNLPAQLFSIDITEDTTLITRHGAVIRIPHGAFTANGNTVQLEIKEAYHSISLFFYVRYFASTISPSVSAASTPLHYRQSAAAHKCH